MAKKKWFSEEQLCDMIQEEVYGEGTFGPIRNQGAFFREFTIAHKLRPDFVNYEDEPGFHHYDVVEVKINADVESVAQLANYLWVFESHIRNAPKGLMEAPYGVTGHLFARTFDRGVYSLATQANIKLWRLEAFSENGKDKILIAEEDHPFEASPLCPRFLQMLAMGNPVDHLHMLAEAASHG